MVDFSKFDKEVNVSKLQEDIKEAKEEGFKDIPKDTYIVNIEKMELGATKEGGYPMFVLQCKISEGAYKGKSLFMYRKIFGNKSEKFTDGKAIQSVITILDKLETATVPEFINYNQFADNILDIYEEVQGRIELEVDYDAKGFNTISIKEVFDIG